MKSASTTSRRRVSADEALALWSEYKRTGDLQVRNRLVMTFAPLVKYIVFKKVRELPARCEVEDFISCGLEALIASIDRYDPAKGATLEQFAWTRIHGAVLDELRRLDWAPRSLRRWERDISRARDQFTAIHGRRPTRDELADSLAISVDDLRRREDDISVSDVTSLNTLVISDDETTVERIDTLAAGDERLDPEHATANEEAKARFRSRVREAAAARARGRRPPLRQEPHAARDRRHPRRLREPRLPDPLAAQADAEAAAVPRSAAVLRRRIKIPGALPINRLAASRTGPLWSRDGSTPPSSMGFPGSYSPSAGSAPSSQLKTVSPFTQASVPSSPSARSKPGPPSSWSSPLPPARRSLPFSASTHGRPSLSLPSPPRRSSFPASPWRRSLPAPASSRSSPRAGEREMVVALVADQDVGAVVLGRIGAAVGPVVAGAADHDVAAAAGRRSRRFPRRRR